MPEIRHFAHFILQKTINCSSVSLMAFLLFSLSYVRTGACTDACTDARTEACAGAGAGLCTTGARRARRSYLFK